MNIFRINGVVQNGNRLEYDYQVEGEWSQYFSKDTRFWSEYQSLPDALPQSVAVLPLIGNVIVMASLLDAEIHVEEIDQDFYQSVEQFLRGYAELSPQVHFKTTGLIHARRVVPCAAQPAQEDMLFFSGGADAWYSLIAHLEDKPTLVSIWGADVPVDNDAMWEKAKRKNQEITDWYGLKLMTIRSTLRRFIDEARLNELSFRLVDDNWWSAFHHSVGMMALAAPYALGARKRLYFASTYSEKDSQWGESYVTASIPGIDNRVRFCRCQVVHDGYECSRHEKVERICEYHRQNPEAPVKIRVCFESLTGDNCGHCEKCANTVMSIVLSGGNPADFGFPYDPQRLPAYFAAGLQEMAREEKYAFFSFYADIQKAFRKKYRPDEVPAVLRAFYHTDIRELADFLHVPCNKCETRKESFQWLENECRTRGEWIRELETAKEWLDGQRNNWMHRAEAAEKLLAQREQRNAVETQAGEFSLQTT